MKSKMRARVAAREEEHDRGDDHEDPDQARDADPQYSSRPTHQPQPHSADEEPDRGSVRDRQEPPLTSGNQCESRSG